MDTDAQGFRKWAPGHPQTGWFRWGEAAAEPLSFAV